MNDKNTKYRIHYKLHDDGEFLYLLLWIVFITFKEENIFNKQKNPPLNTQMLLYTEMLLNKLQFQYLQQNGQKNFSLATFRNCLFNLYSLQPVLCLEPSQIVLHLHRLLLQHKHCTSWIEHWNPPSDFKGSEMYFFKSKIFQIVKKNLLMGKNLTFC